MTLARMILAQCIVQTCIRKDVAYNIFTDSAAILFFLFDETVVDKIQDKQNT
jgi:hypothetical protein